MSNYLEIPSQYKDVNEWYCNTQKETFKDLIEQSIYNKFADKMLDEYITNSYLNELKNNCRQQAKKTLFRELDEELNGGIKSGFYVIGAIPSLRKNNTCFANGGQYSKSRQQSYNI